MRQDVLVDDPNLLVYFDRYPPRQSKDHLVSIANLAVVTSGRFGCVEKHPNPTAKQALGVVADPSQPRQQLALLGGRNVKHLHRYTASFEVAE